MAMTADGLTHQDAHFAQDLSGEEQPPFRGWFVPSGKHCYVGIGDPVLWKPKPKT